MVQLVEFALAYLSHCFFLVVASSSDFHEGTQVVSFSSRQTKATAYIRINDDNKVEYTEGFKVEILISQDVYISGVRFGKNSIATVYIKNGEYSQLNMHCGHVTFAYFKFPCYVAISFTALTIYISIGCVIQDLECK